MHTLRGKMGPSRFSSDQAGIAVLTVVAALRAVLFLPAVNEGASLRMAVVLPPWASAAAWLCLAAVGALTFITPAAKKVFVFVVMFMHFLWGVFYLVVWSDTTHGTRGAGALLLYWTVAALIFWGFVRAKPPATPHETDPGGGE